MIHQNCLYHLMDFYVLPEKVKTELSSKCLNYVKKEFNYENMIKDWDNILENI